MRTILYVGHFEGAPGSTENSYAYAFERHGWHVEKIEQTDAHRYGPDLIAQAADVAKPELLIYTRTHNATALDLRWTGLWRALEGRGVQTASIHLDVFWGIPEREDWIANGDPLFSTGTVFTADGRVSSERQFFEAGVRHHWLPPAMDERNLLSPTTSLPDAAPLPAIVWVGTSAYHSEHPWRAEMVDFLRREYPTRLIEHGYGSPGGVNRDSDYLTTLYSSDTLVVGDSMFSTGDENRYWSDRVPETLGRGGLLLHPPLDVEHYDATSEYVAYTPRDCALLAEAIEGWSGPERYRDRMWMARNGWRKVKEQGTYTHRAATILSTLGLDVQVSA